MRDMSGDRARWFVVTAFATAMAWMEAATVYYLRVLTDRVEPYQQQPLPMAGLLGQVELVRESATMIMLLAVGVLAARAWQKRFAYFLIAFGTWDIFYYVFLRVITGWPRSLFDWDVLFLLPLPWWGPVLAPVCIALLMIAWGTLATQFPGPAAAPRSARRMWGLCAFGVALALYVFMTDAIQSVPQGIDATRAVLPTWFNWPLFAGALALMAAPLAHGGWRASRPPDDRIDSKELCQIN
jgi:hypothetical protein